MSFALPTALILAALALPILVLYILKVRLRRLPVSTNLFWKQLYNEKPPRSIWQRLRHLASLLAQLIVLALIVLAVADPYLPWQLLQARRVVLVVDNSASMQAADVAPSRFEAAKERAHDFISGIRERDEVAIVLAGETPEVVVGMTGHVPTLRRSIDGITVSDKPTHLQKGIRLGQQLVGDHPHGQVIVLSDGCSDDSPRREEGKQTETPAQPRPASYQPTSARERLAPVQWEIFGDDANNIGITQFQARRSLTDAVGYEILVSVWNASSAPVRCRLEVTLNDVPVDVIPLDLKPDEHWKRPLEKTSVEGGTLVARLTKIGPATSDVPADENADAEDTAGTVLNRLAADDTAWAVLPSRTVQKVLIVSPGNHFLRKAFEANPLVDLQVRKTFPQHWPSDTIIVLHRKIPEQIPAGDVLVVDPETGGDHWTVGGVLDQPIITEQDEQSPLMTHIRLDNVIVAQARELQFAKPPTVLAETVTGDAIYAEVQRDTGRCLVLNVNLQQSDLTFRTSFPIMVTNALAWYARQSGDLRPSLATGSLLTVDLPESVAEETADLELISPRGITSTVAVGRDTAPSSSLPANRSATCTIGPFDEAGLWTLVEPAENADADADQLNSEIPVEKTPLRQMAVNLANPRETDLRPSQTLAAKPKLSGASATWLNRPIWFYLALIACVVTAAEWFLYQRRLIT